MKYKKIKIAAALVVVGLIGGVIYNQVTAKKSYDYSDYYVETKTTKKESNKENEEASEKELSLSLLKKTNKDVVGILEFDVSPKLTTSIVGLFLTLIFRFTRT